MDNAKLPVIVVLVLTGLWIAHLVLAKLEKENLRLKKIPVGHTVEIAFFNVNSYQEIRRAKGKIAERIESYLDPRTGEKTFSYSIKATDGTVHLGHSSYCNFNLKKQMWEFHK